MRRADTAAQPAISLAGRVASRLFACSFGALLLTACDSGPPTNVVEDGLNHAVDNAVPGSTVAGWAALRPFHAKNVDCKTIDDPNVSKVYRCTVTVGTSKGGELLTPWHCMFWQADGKWERDCVYD